MSRPALRLGVTCLVAAAVGACAPICGIGSHFTLSSARVDSTYTCPKQVTNHPYDVNATIDADNFTNNTVTIRSIAETDTAVAIHGDWNGELGAKGGGSVADYSPRSIGAGSKARTCSFVCRTTRARRFASRAAATSSRCPGVR